MTTALGGVINTAVTAIGDGMTGAMAIDIGLDFGNPIFMHSLSTFRHPYIIRHSNRPASVCFSRLIFVIGKYRMPTERVRA
ncbi:hypothetical protein [Methylobacter sp.]|uniref:hypothetical protein n=1 Tax=Methylobacter sp. TaxID=2051955 RepID=UPI002FDDBE9E